MYTRLDDGSKLTMQDPVLKNEFTPSQINALAELKECGLTDPEVDGLAVTYGENYIIYTAEEEISGNVIQLNEIKNRIYEKIISAAKTGVSLKNLRTNLLASTHHGENKLILRFIQQGDDTDANILELKKEFHLEIIHDTAAQLTGDDRPFDFFYSSKKPNADFNNALEAFYNLGGELTKDQLREIVPIGTFCRLIMENRIKETTMQSASIFAKSSSLPPI